MKNSYSQPGLYTGLTFNVYRSYGRFGGSDAAYLAMHSPAHWRAWQQQPETPAMRFGKAAHVLILEGRDVFENRYIVKPDFDRRTSAGKSAHIDFVAAHAEREILTPLEYNTLMEMNCAVNESMIASDILKSCTQREVSLFWDCPHSEVQCCGRLDFVGHRIVGDLKTTSDSSPDAFLRSVQKYGYNIQAAHYLDGLDSVQWNDEPIRFLFIAVEKAPPYAVGVYELGDDLLNDGRRLANMARCKLRDAEEYGYYASTDRIVKLTKSGIVENSILDL